MKVQWQVTRRKIRGLFRARAFESDETLAEALKKPDLELGPPPPRAARPGRMNAGGISVFYGANSEHVALAEIRPPGGMRVAVAHFELLQNLKLLDVEALQSVLVRGSYFDASFLKRLERAKFLEHLSHRITAPVMPSDEPFDYLATQAIADYLATKIGLDGIIYPSAQGRRGRNFTLFHHAAKVAPIELPARTEISVSLSNYLDDGFEVDYSVWEEVQPVSEPIPPLQDSFGMPLVPSIPLPVDADFRTPTLRIDVNSIKIHHVQSVSVKTQSYNVRRYRSERRDRYVG